MSIRIYKKNKLITSILLVTLLTSFLPINIHAESARQKDEIKKELITSVYLLNDLLNDEYEELVKEAKQIITDNDFNYLTSMESLTIKGNPRTDIDYIELIAAYLTIKNNANKQLINIKGIDNLDFYKLTYDKKEYEQYEPTKIDLYIPLDVSKNEYIKAGYQYINKKTKIPDLKQKDGVVYEITGEKEVEPLLNKYTYADFKIDVITADEVFAYYGLNKKDLNKDFNKRVEILKDSLTTENITSTVFIDMPKFSLITKEEENKYLNNISNPLRKNIVKAALSLRGAVPYEWGGKPLKAGYDTSWWSFNNNTNKQKGLDCSGFVQWAYMTGGSGSYLYNSMLSTGTILNAGFTQIEEEDLQPGDIGVQNYTDINHTGIYIGNGEWAHCSSSAKTVTVTDSKIFTIFYRAIEDTDTVEVDYKVNILNEINNTRNEYSNDDIYLLAQLISHEAKYEGINGWIAVGEVVKNRINSNLFPDTMISVIYQDGQFSNAGEIKSITPSEEIISIATLVLNEKITVLNDNEVLYFRNPKITSGVNPNENVNWDEHTYFAGIGNHAFYKQ